MIAFNWERVNVNARSKEESGPVKAEAIREELRHQS